MTRDTLPLSEAAAQVRRPRPISTGPSRAPDSYPLFSRPRYADHALLSPCFELETVSLQQPWPSSGESADGLLFQWRASSVPSSADGDADFLAVWVDWGELRMPSPADGPSHLRVDLVPLCVGGAAEQRCVIGEHQQLDVEISVDFQGTMRGRCVVAGPA